MPNPNMMNVGLSIPYSGPIELDPMNLLKHVIALGATGSGKTYISKVMIEESVRLGVPVIAIDTQGDLASLGMYGEISDRQRASDYWKRLDLKIWTPGSEWGIPLSMQPQLDFAVYEKREDRIRAIHAMGLELAALAGSYNDADIAGLSKIIDYAFRHDLAIETLNDVCDFLKDPPQPLIEELSGIFDKKDRQRVLKSLLVKKNGPLQLMLDMGQPIDIDTLFGYEDGGAYDQGKVRISVISLKGLPSAEEQQIFVGNLCRQLYAWMVKDPKSAPIGMLMVDEVAKFIPPVRRNAAKDPLLLLLREARKYGVGLILASQSPGDIMYQGMDQIGTKLLGRMSSLQVAAKVAPLFNYDCKELLDNLPDLKPGEFTMVCPDQFETPVLMRARTLLSLHRTLSLHELGEWVTLEDRQRYGQ